nr:disease resistance-like protein DSC1 [Ziziphus jujuba var. spinosa]
MAGIGKTTLASVVFQKLSNSQFEGFSFLSNVKEEHERHGLNHLRKMLLYELLNDRAILKMDTPFVASPNIIDKLRRKKVLLVLDDVDSSIQLDALVEGYDQLAPGSRIIVTTRNVQVLKKVADNIYKVKGLRHNESLELFHLHAFGKNSPPMDNEILLQRAASYTNGNPLALKFLESILDSHGSFVKIGISVLIDKCLIENNETHKGSELRMHDLLRQMGRTIVRDEHKDPGSRSRLWDAKDVCHILERNAGAGTIEGISLNMFEISKDVKVCRTAFSKMCNLRVLKIYCQNIGDSKFKLHLSQGLDSYLSDKLRYFQWDLYPLKSLPSNFTPENLVELILRGSYIQRLWKDKSLPVLRRMDLSCSKLLKEIPDLSQLAPSLESINLEGCTSLVQVFPCLKNLHKLTYLNLNGCSKLRNFAEISRSRWYLDLVKYGGIKNFLSNIREQNMTPLKSSRNSISFLPSRVAHISQTLPMNLTVLCLSGTTIEEVPLSIESLSGLVELDLGDCKRLTSLPTSICKLKSLESLILAGCVKLEKFPRILDPMERLRDLCLDETGIKELPESIENLISLEELKLANCKEIEFLPNKLCGLRNLEHLCLDGCSKLQKLPPFPPALYSLVLDYCESLISLPDLPLFCSLVFARNCTSLEKISDWIPALQYELNSNFSKVDFSGCGKLDQKTRNTIFLDYAILKILKSGNSDFEFCYPGDEIPKWFSNQTSGTSLKITHPPFWNSDNFLGLAICVVLDLNKMKPSAEVYVHFKLSCKNIDNDCPYDFHSNRFLHSDRESLDHVFMWYVPKCSLEESKQLSWPSICISDASLHLWLLIHDPAVKEYVDLGSEYCEIKKCGVRVVNEEDVERFNAETIQSKRNRQDFDGECCEASESDRFVPSGSPKEED